MFKKSRRKIVAAIMSILTVLWVGTLAVIYISSYHEITSTNLELLEEQSRQYILNKPVDGGDPMRPFPNRGPHWNTDRFKLATFYSVAFSYDGDVIEIDNDDAEVYSDQRTPLSITASKAGFSQSACSTLTTS